MIGDYKLTNIGETYQPSSQYNEMEYRGILDGLHEISSWSWRSQIKYLHVWATGTVNEHAGFAVLYRWKLHQTVRRYGQSVTHRRTWALRASLSDVKPASQCSSCKAISGRKRKGVMAQTARVAIIVLYRRMVDILDGGKRVLTVDTIMAMFRLLEQNNKLSNVQYQYIFRSLELPMTSLWKTRSSLVLYQPHTTILPVFVTRGFTCVEGVPKDVRILGFKWWMGSNRPSTGINPKSCIWWFKDVLEDIEWRYPKKRRNEITMGI